MLLPCCCCCLPAAPMPTSLPPRLQVDLVSEGELQQVEAELRGINSEAAAVRCLRCEIDLGLILNTGMYSASGRAPTVLAEAAAAAPGAASLSQPGGKPSVSSNSHAGQEGREDGHEHGHECGPSCSHPGHNHHPPHQHHQHQIGTVTVLLEQPLSLQRLRHFLDELLWEGGSRSSDCSTAPDVNSSAAPDIMRLKGLLNVAGSQHKQVLQGVHELYDIVEGPAWQPGEPRLSKLVFIGRRLVRDDLTAGLSACTEQQV